MKMWYRFWYPFGWTKKYNHTLVKWYGLVLAEESLYDVSSDWFYVE